MKVPFGRYEGRELWEIPDGYLSWLSTRAIDDRTYPGFRRAIGYEISRRNLSAQQSVPNRTAIEVGVNEVELAAKLVKEGHRSLSKKLHPDLNGGDGHSMQSLNNLRDSLLNQLQEIGGAR